MAEHHHHRPSTSGTRTDSDYMDIDEVMVVPDTPDRVSRQPKNVRSVEFSLRNSGAASRVSMDRMSRRVGDSNHAAGMHSRGNVGVKAQSQSASCSVAPSSSFRNAPMSSMVVGKTFKHKEKYHSNHEQIEDDKVTHPSMSGKSSHYHKSSEDPVLVGHGERAKSSTSTRDGLGAQKTNKGFLLPNKSGSLNTAGDSSKSSRNDTKEKAKAVQNNPVYCNTSSYKLNDNICLNTSDRNTGKSLSVSPLVSRVPRMTEKKRLVRNGCISPHNIAKAKSFEETSGNGQNTERAEVSGSSHPVIEVNEANVKQSAAVREVSAREFRFAMTSILSDVHHFADGRCKGKFPENDYVFVQDTSSNSNKAVLGKGTSSVPSTLFEQKPVLSEGQLHTPTSSIKRQRKHGLSSGSPEKSTEVICLSSGGASSTMKSVNDHGGFPQRELGSPLVVDELSPKVIESTSQTDDDSEAMALQLQADEMLARELQEQLYNEIPESTSGERLSTLGLAEQQGDSLQLASSRRNHQAHHSVGPSVSNRSQASQAQSLRNRLFRRGARARSSRSNLPRLRNRLHNHARRGDSFFPSDMDLDMRIDLLETWEAVISDDIRMVNQLLDSDREFGENDYEMLLALDDNNHTHLGASAAQIANLPESTVNIDNSEVCSICLEIPAIGDTMRHLPCFHKFHKDCIDPWLSRKRSCPVCKSDL
ncbi:E3 ubiquitin-protein ligase SDIR1 [Bienertia sinuspersici]